VPDPVRPAVREEVARPAALVSLATFSSRIGGLVRESLFAALFGIHPAADAFVVAFRIPNLFRDLFAEGALSSAFVPTYARVRAERGPEAGFLLARTVLGTLLAVTCTLALLGILFARPIVDAIAFGATEDRRAMAVPLTRIMFPFLPTVAAAAVWMGVLNSHGRYLVPAFAPVAFNLASILGGVALLLLGWDVESAIVGWAVFVLLGGLAQALCQAPATRSVGLRGAPRVDLAFRDPGLRTIVRRMAPVAVALAGTQVMIVVSTGVATGHEGWVSALNYGFRLIHLPIGLVGVALGTVSLAAASRRAAAGDATGLDDVIRRGLRLNAFLSIPAAVGLAVLAEPVVRLVYERGKFDLAATALAVDAVRWYAIGIVFYAGVKVAAAAFHARGDTRRPMNASLVGIAANLGIAVAGTAWWGFSALPLATAVGSAVNYGLLRAFDRRRGRVTGPGVAFLGKVIAATTALAAAAYAGDRWLLHREGPLGHGLALLAGTAIVIGASSAAFFTLSHVLRIEEASVVARLWARLRGGQSPTAR